jgi:hypothetical protein
MNQINSIHILTPQFYKIHFNIFVPSRLSLPNFPSGFLTKFFRHAFLGYFMRAACPTHINFFYFIILISVGEEHVHTL